MKMPIVDSALLVTMRPSIFQTHAATPDFTSDGAVWLQMINVALESKV